MYLITHPNNYKWLKNATDIHEKAFKTIENPVLGAFRIHDIEIKTDPFMPIYKEEISYKLALGYENSRFFEWWNEEENPEPDWEVECGIVAKIVEKAPIFNICHKHPVCCDHSRFGTCGV